MERHTYPLKQIQQIFRMEIKSKQTIFNAEERREIPTALRVPRGSGKIEERRWLTEHLPEIGKKFGFLKHELKRQEIISCYTQKGGTLKSNLAYTLARIFALNGIRVILIGLDTQGSVTNIALGQTQPESLEELKRQKEEWGGLYHLLFQDGIELSDVVKTTDLPTLDVIPETGELAELERRLQGADGREAIFKKKLIPLLKDYQIVVMDNSPSWNQLVKNSLFCADTVVSPVGCDVGTYEVLDTNMRTLSEFQHNLGIEWRNFLMVPSLLEKTKLSQQIYGSYLSTYAESMISCPIRRAVVGQEASFLKRSVLEYDPSSSLANDYYDLAVAVWKRIIDGQRLMMASVQGVHQ